MGDLDDIGKGLHEELEARAKGIGKPLSAMERMALESFRDHEQRHKDGKPLYNVNRTIEGEDHE